MDFKFSKDSDNLQQQGVPDDKKKQSALLVLLLILVGGFSYIYFFTGLIKPEEAAKTAPPPAPIAQAQIVKIPLPTREGEPAKPDTKVPEKSVATNVAAPAQPAAKPAPLPPKQAPVAAAKPAVPAAKAIPAAKSTPPKEDPKKTAAKPSDKKPLPVVVAKKTDNKTTPATKKPAEAEKKEISAKTGAKKPAAGGQAKADTKEKVNKAAPGMWSIIAGNYVLEEALSADMGRIRKAGFQPIVKASTRKKVAMNRLFVNEYSDRATAQTTMNKLKKQTSDAFIIEQGGKFAIYAGSYLQNDAANSEKERLQSIGFPVTIKKIDIAIPSQSLSIGPFNSNKAANAALAKLKNSGIKASLLQK